MNLEWAGIVLSLFTVATIGGGHVAVRKINYRYGTKPVPAVALLGLGIIIASLFVESTILSGVLGIVGITTLWDALELVRQEKRVLKGHAPRNPARFPKE